ncbi:YhdP family protein [Geobacter pickeringii]|uniref:AsmA family protein n=1 Tax=Geobacter pickeringii TaxID=345632 RepID=A0A0B5BBS1_9BACT|nr:AsmA-like C-terminal domain-containing protein [Geobacter pickeringii]AJE03957.1 AsmA family protein [Geobacter pickeringii]
MTPKRRNLIIAVLLTLAVLLGAAGTILVARLHELDTYKGQILAEVEKALNRKVTYEKGDVSIGFGPAFSFTRVAIMEKDGSSVFATADRLSFRLALLPLLDKRVVIRTLEVERPTARIVRTPDGTFNISDLLEEKKEGVALRLRGIRIADGTVTFTDRAAAPDGVVTVFEKTDLSLDRLTRGKRTALELSTTIAEGRNRSTLSVRGSVKLAPKDHPLADSRVDVKVLARNLDAGHYWPYYARFVPFRQLAGRFNLESHFEGTAGDFASKGTVRVAGLRFDYPQVFHAVLTPRDLQLAYEMKRTSREVDISAVDLRMDGLAVKGSCAIKDINTRDPRIVARTTIAPFQLEKFFWYIPFGIIADDTSRFIEQHIKGGTFRVDDGRLDGRISQILHMERGQNYNILTVRARALGGAIVDMGHGVPPFTGIKGELELAGKNFTLRNMAGKFGSSPFTMNGMISDYPLDTPSGYPFSAVVSPEQPELAWLMGPTHGARLHLAGGSTLRLTGAGFTSGYTLNGEWNLAGAAYSFVDVVAKPAGQPNTLSFKLGLGRTVPTTLSCQYTLPPLALGLNARFHPGKGTPNHLEIRSNQFSMAAVAPLVPRARPYLPQGRMQVNARGEGEAESLADMNWSGEIALGGASFRPAADMKPLGNINGSIRFRGKSLETPRLSMMLGSSPVSGRGTLTGFDNPSFAVDFSSPSLDLADLGLRSPKGAPRIQQLQGSLSLHEDTLRIRTLSGKVNNSVFSLKGTVEDLRHPRTDLTLSAPFLDVGDVILLAGVRRPGTGNGSPLTIRAAVNADAGRYENLPFKKLKSVAMYEDGILYLQPLEFGAFGGTVSGRVRADFGSAGQSRYQASLTVDDVSAEQLVQALNLRLRNEIITGSLALQAELTAKGESVADLKKTLLGNVKLHLQDGSLRKYSVLSKIFSILNVSQLFKFRLPDMVSGGMPYNEINATFSVHDGVIASNDLFIDSEAMNISAVGKIDLFREEIDATVGVQPLQTVDKVVNRIPIVGWILTGKDKNFITTYFEAKGKWDDPVVTAIPVKSMARGVFDIFKRVFQLPAKLFTDTGEVILGK